MTETTDQPQTALAQLQALQSDLGLKLAALAGAAARLRVRNDAVGQAASRVPDPSA